MADPSRTAAGVLGLKYATLLAGFAGGVVSLVYLRELAPAQMVLAVFTGSACAGYLTSVAKVFWHYIRMPLCPSLINLSIQAYIR